MPEFASLAETSLDHLKLALEVGEIGVWELDLATGSAWRNRRHDRIFGYDVLRDSWTLDDFLAHVVPADRERVAEQLRDAIEQCRDWVFECRIVTSRGDTRWITVAGRPLRGEDGKAATILGHMLDVTEVKRTEDRLRTLTQELNHRVRNMLATIQATIKLSMRNSATREEFAAALEGRVAALARTHEMFVSRHDKPVMPSAVFERELDAYADFRARADIVVVSEVPLELSRAEGLSLVAHELITNAIKHGAFSNDSGQVRVAIEQADDGSNRIVWSEMGGPPVVPPTRKGFGTGMIDRVLGGDGSAVLDYAPGGLTCTIKFVAVLPSSADQRSRIGT